MSELSRLRAGFALSFFTPVVGSACGAGLLPSDSLPLPAFGNPASFSFVCAVLFGRGVTFEVVVGTTEATGGGGTRVALRYI